MHFTLIFNVMLHQDVGSVYLKQVITFVIPQNEKSSVTN